MRPIKLEFKGINSFSEHTIIDFEALTKNGIFGIFGDTGSGKSTILDSINFALYGNVERSKEKADIINYRCNSAEVNFIFDIFSEGKRKIYTVERLLKRDKSGTHKAMLYESDGDEQVCIADKASAVEKKIVEILGVSAEDFRKCIALPQGEFSQFVKSAPRDRLALVERLFSLSVYGDKLKEKLAARQMSIENEYQNFSGRLQSFENVSEQLISVLSDKIDEQTDKLNNLLLEFKALRENAENIKTIYAKRKELSDINVKLAELLNNKQKIEELRNGLSVLPFCLEAVNVSDEIKAKRNKICEIEQQTVLITENIEELSNKIIQTDKLLKDGEFDEKISQCVALAAQYAACGGKPEKLESLNKALENKRKEYYIYEDERSDLNARRKYAQAELEKTENAVNNLSLSDLDGLLGAEFKGAVLKDEYVYNLNYFSSLRSGVEVLKDNSPLYEYVNDEIKNKINEYKQRVLDLKDFSESDLKNKLNCIQTEIQKKENLLKVLNSQKENLTKIDSALDVNANNMQTVKKDGAELRARVDELKAEIAQVFGEGVTNFSERTAQNDRELKRLKDRKGDLLSESERLKQAKAEYDLKFRSLKTLSQTLLSDCENLAVRLKEIVKRCNYKSFDECEKLAAAFAEYSDAAAVVREYDEKLSVLSVRKKELESCKGINEISSEDLLAIEQKTADAESEIGSVKENIAVMKAEKASYEKQLAEKTEILKQFDGVISQRNLLSQLKEVTKNNKFMEFIAGEYLCEVADIASSTLLSLTDGRYFLTYKDNNFYVADNFDCGNLRGVNTLSGGETFLVSLSLALALSHTICAKSMKNIEFFFLDEGFGTLDSTLVDTVMNALEKLKNAHFTIGVISHVEELKHRIDSKITVKKATETHGSTVLASC